MLNLSERCYKEVHGKLLIIIAWLSRPRRSERGSLRKAKAGGVAVPVRQQVSVTLRFVFHDLNTELRTIVCKTVRQVQTE